MCFFTTLYTAEMIADLQKRSLLLLLLLVADLLTLFSPLLHAQRSELY
jgi:hypothetical protein